MSKAHDEKVNAVMLFMKEVTADGGEWLTGLNERMTRIVATGLIAQLQQIDNENQPPKPGPIKRANPGHPKGYWEEKNGPVGSKPHYGIGDVD